MVHRRLIVALGNLLELSRGEAHGVFHQATDFQVEVIVEAVGHHGFVLVSFGRVPRGTVVRGLILPRVELSRWQLDQAPGQRTHDDVV